MILLVHCKSCNTHVDTQSAGIGLYQLHAFGRDWDTCLLYNLQRNGRVEGEPTTLKGFNKVGSLQGLVLHSLNCLGRRMCTHRPSSTTVPFRGITHRSLLVWKPTPHCLEHCKITKAASLHEGVYTFHPLHLLSSRAKAARLGQESTDLV